MFEDLAIIEYEPINNRVGLLFGKKGYMVESIW